MFQPDMSGRDFERKMEGLEREQDISRHTREAGRGPRRWLWALGVFAVPSDPGLP